MHYQENWKRPKEITDSAQEADYYNKYEAFTDELTGQHFFGKVIYAYTTISSFKNKNSGKKMQSEVLHLIILIKNSRSYIQVDIWGSKRSFDDDTNAWGEWGDNPVKLQDFLYLARRFKGVDVDIEESYNYSTQYEDRTVYPHLCGVELSILGAKVGEREYKGKFYTTNEFALFNADGHSAQELQLKIKDLDDIHAKLKELKQKYQEWLNPSTDEAPQAFDDRDVEHQRKAVAEAQTQPTFVDTNPINPLQSALEQASEVEPYNADDDLPF